jgi:hypothetical protein
MSAIQVVDHVRLLEDFLSFLSILCSFHPNEWRRITMGDTAADHRRNLELRKLPESSLDRCNSRNFVAGFASRVQIDGRLVGEKPWEAKLDIEQQ